MATNGRDETFSYVVRRPPTPEPPMPVFTGSDSELEMITAVSHES